MRGRQKWWVPLATRYLFTARINDEFLMKFAGLGSLEGTLGCCFGLGIDKNEVRAIHALIYT